MYSPASPPSSTSCKIDSLMAVPIPCCQFPSAPFTPPPLQYTVKHAAVNPSYPFRLAPYNPIISPWLCLQTSMMSSAWPRPCLPLTARVRALNVPTVNSPSPVLYLAALRTARVTRRGFRPLLFLFRVSFHHITFRQLWFLLCLQRVACSTLDPPHPPPSCLVGGLLTWDLLSFLPSILRSPRFPR